MDIYLPHRESKPRTTGQNIIIDNGLATNNFTDIVSTFHTNIDFVKFGWCTSYISPNIQKKIDVLEKYDIDFFFGGTLFEKSVLQHKVDDFIMYCKNYGCEYIEISNGTIDLSNTEKGKYISELKNEFKIFSEVGYKDSNKSKYMKPATWVHNILEDFDNGAIKVITEARESGKSGVCKADGEIRFGIIEEIVDSRDIDTNNLIFEAPNIALQEFFIKKIGVNVNLANINFNDIIALETLRLGLRSNTLTFFEGEKDA